MERSTFTAKPTQNILLVDDDAAAIQLMGAILGNVATLRFATNGRDAMRLARELAPDVILLDAEMPGMSGFELLGMLKAEPSLADVPAIFITGHTEAGFEVSALDMGAADFIAKPFRSSLVLARVRTHLRMKRLADELRHAATTDSLTGVWNRRHFDESLHREWLRARRSSDPLSLLLIDVDHFKMYNDRYGHQQGDVCLMQVAQALKSACLRPADLVARYGGEEFMMLLPQTPRRGAEQIGARVLERVKALGIYHEDSVPHRHVSVSIGIACHDAVAAACGVGKRCDCGVTPQALMRPLPSGSGGVGKRCDCGVTQLVQAADRALYCAKRAGRGQAILGDLNDMSPQDPSIVVPPTIHRSDTQASSRYRQHPWSSRTTR